MKLSLYFLIFLFAGFTNSIFASDPFIQGYLVTLEGDTVHGFIDNASSFTLAQKCIFKSSKDQPQTVYRPGEISSFWLNNERYYISKEVEWNDTTRVVFLEFLFEGEVNLYRYNGNKLFFVIEKDDQTYQLTNEYSEIKIRGQNYMKQSNEYKGMLKYLLQSNPELNQKINTSSFSQRSLVRIVNDYHEYTCPDSVCYNYTKPELRSDNNIPKSFIEPYFGLNYIKINSYYPIKKTLFSDVSSNFGAQINFSPGFKENLLSFKAGVQYSSFSGIYKDINEQVSSTDTEGEEIKFTNLNVVHIFQINIPIKSIILYCNTGIGLSFFPVWDVPFDKAKKVDVELLYAVGVYSNLKSRYNFFTQVTLGKFRYSYKLSPDLSLDFGIRYQISKL